MDFDRVWRKILEFMLYDVLENWDVLFFILIFGLEFYRPYFKEKKENVEHFFTNFGHVIVSKVFILLSLSLAGFSFRYLDRAVLSKGFISSLELSYIAKLLISFVILDLVVYWQHRLSHSFSFLWAFHQVHHQDNL